MRQTIVTAAALVFSLCGANAQQGGAAAQANGVSGQHGRVVITKDHTTMMLEPYAPNVIRVSISRLKAHAMAAPGYGIIAKPDAAGWKFEKSANGRTYESSRLAVTIMGPAKHHSPHL
ncbi:MAG: alpha-glucosidase, partial [Bryobacteraceae bacterium]